MIRIINIIVLLYLVSCTDELIEMESGNSRANGNSSLKLSVVTKTLDYIALHDESPVEIVISSNNQSPDNIQGYIEFKDGDNDKLLLRKEINGDVSTNSPLKIIDPLGNKGCFNVNYYFRINDVSETSGRVVYCNMFHNSVIEDNQGINLGLQGVHRATDFNEAYETIKSLGVNMSRMDMSWKEIEATQGYYDFGTRDTKIDKYVEAGIKPQLLLSYTPKWAAPVDKQTGTEWRTWGTCPPEDMENWRKFVRKVAERYKDKAYYYEIWNEADWEFFSGTTEDYLEILRIAYEEIKAVDNNNMVLTSGFAKASPFQGDPIKDFQAVVLEKGREYFDFHAMHQHGEFSKYITSVEDALRYRQQIGLTKPIYFNETAIHSTDGKVYQAEQIVKKAVYAFSVGSEHYDLFSYQDPPGEDKPFGVVESKTFYPKPVLPAYSMLIKALQGKVFSHSLKLQNGGMAYGFTDDKQSVLVLWNDNITDGSDVISINADSDIGESYDIYGNSSVIKSYHNVFPITISGQPSYLIINKPNIEFEEDKNLTLILK